MGKRFFLRDISRVRSPGQGRHGVVLLSGGLDSAVTLYMAGEKGFKLRALIFDYGQRHKKEILFAKNIAEKAGISYSLVKINLPWVESSLTKSAIPVPKNRDLSGKDIPLTYVSGRNIIFLSYAFSFAESIGAGNVFIGAHINDYSGYPDCRPEFLEEFAVAVNKGLRDKEIRLIAPLIDKSKKEIVRAGIKLKVPFELTWSCYNGGPNPCLTCDSCRFRQKAFVELGEVDPVLKKIMSNEG